MERVSHYELIRRLGQGGMGEVHEAVDLELGRRVAIKFVAGHFADDPEALRRFEREARLAAALQHPHIATVFAFERGGARAFLVLELLAGRTLRDVLASGPLGVPEALGLARDVAGALAYAHRRDVVHRDIKPENLMFDAEGVVKITDFGLARAADASRLTRTGSTLGTPAYMAPELFHGDGGGGAPADVFALGVTLYETLAGSPPFRGDGPLSVLYAIANTEPRPLGELRPELPPAAAALVARMLAKDPAARATAAEAAATLADLTGVARSTTLAGVAADGAPAGERVTTSAVTLEAERVPHPDSGAALPVPVPPAAVARRRRAPALLAGLFATAALAAAVVWGALAARAAARRQAVALVNEGHDSLAAGATAAARRRFEAALERAPDYAEAKLNLATLLAGQGGADRAAALFAQVLRENPRRPELLAAAHYGLGELDLDARAWPAAITHFAAARQLDSARAEYPNNLAFALVQAGRTGDALAALRAARARFPAEPALLKNTALAYLASGEPDSALAAAERCVRLRPAYAAGWLVKLESEVARGDRAAARASFAALAALAPGEAVLAEARAALAPARALRYPAAP